MQDKSRFSLTKFRAGLMATAIAAGVAGFTLGGGNISPVTQSYADAVKVEAPATFSFANVVDAVSPAVVSVRVEAKLEVASAEEQFDLDRDGRRFFEEFFRRSPRGEPNRGPRGKRFGASQGSGFFVSDDGYVVTNNHVVENGSKFTIVSNDGSEYDAKLIGTDPRTDLAVLKVEADQEFTYVEFGDDRPRVGEWVVAVGNPFGLGGTVTAGIVSAHGREIGASRYEDFVQIDAAVNKGNSGGPTFNLSGEVIGVNTAIFSPSGGNVGIAFAIPAALADEIVTDLIEDGSVTRGWLGVQIQPMTSEIGESLGLDLKQGTIITAIEEGSPAETSGLRSGDVISQVEGKPIKGPKELARVIAGFEPNSQVKLNIWRNAEEQTIAVELGTLQRVSNGVAGDDSSKPLRLGKLGIALEKTENGLVVAGVKPGSPAARKGLQVGDVIKGINGNPIDSATELQDQLKSARQEGRKSALLQIERQDRAIFIPVPIRRG
ncbi:MAG: Do family serine endopeptidase [Pseudomonadota bacterium]